MTVSSDGVPLTRREIREREREEEARLAATSLPLTSTAPQAPVTEDGAPESAAPAEPEAAEPATPSADEPVVEEVVDAEIVEPEAAEAEPAEAAPADTEPAQPDAPALAEIFEPKSEVVDYPDNYGPDTVAFDAVSFDQVVQGGSETVPEHIPGAPDNADNPDELESPDQAAPDAAPVAATAPVADERPEPLLSKWQSKRKAKKEAAAAAAAAAVAAPAAAPAVAEAADAEAAEPVAVTENSAEAPSDEWPVTEAPVSGTPVTEPEAPAVEAVPFSEPTEADPAVVEAVVNGEPLPESAFAPPAPAAAAPTTHLDVVEAEIVEPIAEEELVSRTIERAPQPEEPTGVNQLAPLFTAPPAPRQPVTFDEASFDDLIGATQPGSNSQQASIFVMPSVPTESDVNTALNATGEVIITGSIEIPDSISTTGVSSAVHDTSDLDTIIDQMERAETTTGITPVSASASVSAAAQQQQLVVPPAKKGNAAPIFLGVTAAVLAVAVVGLILAAFVFKIF